ncbi:MAG: LysM peptidoglycan-binding domain-containing protein [Spirochaetaceae bacterium]|jgi:nucleoid-associated protein YgaU|nr:LysM peptidoglycan-binding domain-containing protein [Spirochaetaceae bacterium]
MKIIVGAGAKRLPLMFVLIQICVFAFGAVTAESGGALSNIRNNSYLTESLRLQALARQTFEAGDYDAAAAYAENAVKSAAASDYYVGQQVKIHIANSRMNDALQRLVWADSADAKHYFPVEFYDAKTYYNLGLIAKDASKWDDTIDNADKVIKTLAGFTVPPKDAVIAKISDAAHVTVEKVALPEKIPARQDVLPVEDGEKPDKSTPLPAQYTVRAWDKYGDCFWNIAGHSWVYGDPHRWPLLYQANKDRIPNPKNPDLIEPGTVLDIPSLNGEERSGRWSPDAVYSPLKK